MFKSSTLCPASWFQSAHSEGDPFYTKECTLDKQISKYTHKSEHKSELRVQQISRVGDIAAEY